MPFLAALRQISAPYIWKLGSESSNRKPEAFLKISTISSRSEPLKVARVVPQSRLDPRSTRVHSHDHSSWVLPQFPSTPQFGSFISRLASTFSKLANQRFGRINVLVDEQNYVISALLNCVVIGFRGRKETLLNQNLMRMRILEARQGQ